MSWGRLRVKNLVLPTVKFTEEQDAFRGEVRQFLKDEEAKGSFVRTNDSWLSGYSTEFSKKMGKQGWIGMTWPREYGGQERSPIERYIVTEETLAAGAPVALHWFADRQSGLLFLRFGTRRAKTIFLTPNCKRGMLFFNWFK